VKTSTNGISPFDQYLLILHGRGFHITLEVVEEAKNVGLDLLTLPFHISHEFHPSDVNVLSHSRLHFTSFGILKV